MRTRLGSTYKSAGPAKVKEGHPAAWFCLRSQPKHEHIAAAHLRKMDGVEAYLPRIRFQRPTRRGIAWVTEALFPGYLFARFDWTVSLRQVQAASGVRGVVHFGDEWPAIPPQVIQELRQAIGADEPNTISFELSPGDAVHIAQGTLQGLRAVIFQVMPGRERIAVLMDFLGRQTRIELDVNAVLKEGGERIEAFRGQVKSNS